VPDWRPSLLDFELANVCLVKMRRQPTQRDALRAAFRLAHRLRVETVSVDHAATLDLAEAGSDRLRCQISLEGLRLLVRVRNQAKALADLKGLGWDGDLDEMRQGRPPRRS
jgi:hypothetical protein